MSGEENFSFSSSEFQRQQRSNEARAAAQAPRRIATRRPLPSTTTRDQHQTTIPSPARRSSASPYYHHELTADDAGSFADERFISKSSWEEAPSFDSEEQRAKPANRPHDRRKQFDTTTPTLIDEEEGDEDDSEMLQLQRSYDQGKDAEQLRRTPGASMYKSTFEPSQDDVILAHVRRTPGASAMHRSGPTVGVTSAAQASAPVAPSLGPSNSGAVDEPLGTSVGLSFALALSTTVGSDDASSSSPGKEKQQRRIAWDSYQSSPQVSPDGTETIRPALAQPPASPNRQPEPRGLFSFEPWARPKSPGSTTPGGGRLNSGAFSPNILRLTEDIGNLLQEDEDDDYALAMPSVFRGSGDASTSNASGTDFDWTGSYVFDSEHRRKPAVPSRSAVGAEKSARRRGSIESRHFQQPSHQQGGSSGFLPNAQQPKPRRNEVFEFGKASRSTPSEERESPQLLIFGGAFAPPATGVHNGGFMRPVASFQGADATSSSTKHQHVAVSPFLPTAGHEMNRPRVASMPPGYHLQDQQQPGTFQVGVANLSDLGPREHSLSYDSYQSGKQGSGQMGGPYFQTDAYSSSSPTYGLSHSLSYANQQSEMQASAQVFIPQSTRIAAPQYIGQPPQQQQWHAPQCVPVQQYDSSLEQDSWHSNASYNYGSSSFGYGMQAQAQQSFGDPRAGMTPSPHLPSWQQQQAMPQTMDPSGMYRGVPQQHSRVESAASAAYMTSPSPHPSMAGSEHSTTTTQRGGKKDPKRKQRGKKKPQKTEASGGSGKKATVATKKKGEVLRPGSTTQSVDGNDDPHASTSEDPIDAKRSELVESPATRIAFKEFYRAFRSEERLSFQKAEEFALGALEDESLPDAVHWRVYLELADLAKRSNRYVEARCLYQKVCQLQPYASQGWLEYSKLEEECGRMNRVMNILHQGLNYCEYSENLLTRAVKHQEKMGNLANARGLLARLKHVGIEKVWRTVLEGALLEARAGNVATARRVLKYLMHHVPWYGPLYLEAYRLEKDQGHTLDALHVVERGLQAIPRYGPLWFGAFRLCEEMDLSKKLYHLPSTMNMIERAAVNISKELVWKVHLDAAQMLERSALEQASIDDPNFDALLAPARRRLAMTILTSPNNLRWKVWLAAARMELGFGNAERARSLFLRAHEVVPGKGRSSTLLECARLEDFVGDTNLARAILCKGRVQCGHDWKVWLESVLLEIRGGYYLRAMEICDSALEIHQGTGRLWATLVQLRQFYGRDEAQLIALRRALNAVPKSGEVWCEGGRIHLNPFSDTFDLERARRHLYFATRFTPQYGDGFIETIRLELVKQWLAPIGSFVWEKTKHAFQPGAGGALEDGLTKYVTDVSLAISVASRTVPEKGYSQSKMPKLLHQDIVATVRKQLNPEVHRTSIDLNDVRLACVNADPNYGLLWFHCRHKATDTPRRIIEDAAGIMVEELRTYAHLYLAAMIRREAVLSMVDLEKPASLLDDAIETSDPDVVKWEDYIDAKLHAAPSLEEMFNPTDPTTGMVLLESTASGPLFATGLSKLNKRQPIETMSLTDRRRALFGNDALFP